MKYFSTIVLAIILIVSFSCRKDFTTIENYGNLSFSKDTVYLDTVFTNIGSSTYNLKVYNNSSNAITIPEISLENGLNSNYRLNIDGIPGKYFEDIEILANDSIFVFVETTIDYDAVTDPLYTDKILFDNGNNQQDVDLVTLVQDANFIYPDRDVITLEIDSLTLDGIDSKIFGRYLGTDELTFTNEKPYVIYGYAAVPKEETLTIDAGAQIYFHSNSGLIIDTDASLKVNGTLEEKVVFEGDRLEHYFHDVAGQWGTIWMRKGSKENEINHAEIKNAAIGIIIDSIGSSTAPTLKIQNSKVYNHSAYSILGRETHIEASNVVVGSAGESSFAGIIGGTYDFIHCTFANYWTRSIRSLPAVLINNFFEYTDNTGQDIVETRNLNAANFVNCIFEGNGNVELLFDEVESGDIFNFNVNNCLIRYNDINEDYVDNTNMNFDNDTHYQNNILNGTPDFKDTTTDEYSIGENSDAINNGVLTTITTDIIGTLRTPTIDIGAYQHTSFDEEE